VVFPYSSLGRAAEYRSIYQAAREKMRLEPDTTTSLEQLQRRLARLVCERQQRREAGESRESLEENRLAIASSQQELSQALIRLHLGRPAPARRAA
jgi:hypothetical protein